MFSIFLFAALPMAHIRTLRSVAWLILLALVLAGTLGARAEETPTYGWIGARIQAVTDEVAKKAGMTQPQGVLVVGIDDNGPLKAAGIQAGDILVKYDGRDIKGVQDLQGRILGTPPGKQVEIVVLRDGEQDTKTVKVGRLLNGGPTGVPSQQAGIPPSQPENTVSAMSGVAIQIGTAWARDKDCNALPVSIALTHPPSHGKVSLVPGMVTAAHERVGGSAAHCGETQQLAGKKIIYQSNPDFHGTDVVSYTVQLGERSFSNTITINVR